MFRKIRFSCPTCHGKLLEEVEPHETRHGLLGCSMERLRFSRDDGEDVITDRFFRCGGCDYVLKSKDDVPLRTVVEVLDWLDARHMLLSDRKQCTKCHKDYHQCKCYPEPTAGDGGGPARDKRNGYRKRGDGEKHHGRV